MDYRDIQPNLTPERPRQRVVRKFEEMLVYADEHLAVVNKPPGLSTLDERNAESAGLLHLARRWDSNCQVAHRLDKHTSGILLMARTPEAYRSLSKQFMDRSVRKAYVALVERLPDTPRLEISAPIRVLKNGKATVDFNTGKPATTIIEIAQQFRTYTLMRCYPVTGRMHQIRLHLAYIGSPIVGDIAYGGKPFLLSSIKPKYRTKPEEGEKPLNYSFLLHAESLQFVHPATGQTLKVEAQLDDNFAMILKKLHAFDALQS